MTLTIILPAGVTGLDGALNHSDITFAGVIALTITSGATGNDGSYPNLATKLTATTELATLTLTLNAVTNDYALYKAVKNNSNITTTTWAAGAVARCLATDIDNDTKFDAEDCLATTVKAS